MKNVITPLLHFNSKNVDSIENTRQRCSLSASASVYGINDHEEPSRPSENSIVPVNLHCNNLRHIITMHSLNIFSLAHAFIAAPLIIPRGAHDSERKYIAVMKANVASKAITSRVAGVPSDAEYTYYNLFNSFSASLTKPELKDLLNDPNVDFIEKVSTMHGASTQKNVP